MDLRDETTIHAIMDYLIANRAAGMARVSGQLFEMAMQIEPEQHLNAAHYERTPERLGYANGYKPRRIDRLAGTVTIQVPQTAGHGDDPFYPQSLVTPSPLSAGNGLRAR